jgi:hypothetical protein
MLAACGGGGSGSGPSPILSAAPTATPTMPTPTMAPTANPSATFTPLPTPQGSPATLASFTVGAEQNAIPPGTPGLQYTPDEQMSFLRAPDGSFELWAAGGGTYGAYLFKTLDFSTLGTPTTVLTPSGPGTTAFDADYAGPGSVFPASNGTDLLMIYHGENHLYGGHDYPGTPFYATVGLARSHDDGMTWQKEGAIISGADPQQATQTEPGAGALAPSAIEVGGYIYVIYREMDLQSNVNGFAIARAPIAGDAAPGTWQKYANGSFGTPGLGGTFTALGIVLDPTLPADERQPNVSFNTYLNAYVMTAVGNGGIYILTSPDLIAWSAATIALAAPEPDSMAGNSNGPRNWHPTLVSPNEPSSELSAQTGFLYYDKFLGDGTENHYMYRRAFSMTAGSSPQLRVRARTR